MPPNIHRGGKADDAVDNVGLILINSQNFVLLGSVNYTIVQTYIHFGACYETHRWGPIGYLFLFEIYILK